MPHLIRDVAEGFEKSLLSKVIRPDRGGEPERFFDLEEENAEGRMTRSRRISKVIRLER
jgi:hypothetical protein